MRPRFRPWNTLLRKEARQALLHGSVFIFVYGGMSMLLDCACDTLVLELT